MTNSEILGNTKQNGLLEFFNLMVEKGTLNNQDKMDYEAGKKIFYTADLYVRKYIGQTLSGVVDVITENEVEFITRCNLSKGRIPEEQNIIMSHFELKYGEATSDVSTTPEAVKYSNCIYDVADLQADAGRSVIASTTVVAQRIPTAFISSEYELKCDDGLIDKGRTSELLVNNTVTQNLQGSGNNARLLFWPKLLPGGKTLRLAMKFPTGTMVPVTPSSTYFFVEVGIKGIYLGKRPNA